MAIVKTYRNPEEAYIDAGYLCSQGIEAVVDQGPGYGGALFGVLETPYRLDVPESQLEEAQTLLDQRPVEDSPPPAPPPKPVAVEAARLTGLFNFILTFDIVCVIAFSFFGSLLFPVPPVPVSNYLNSMVLSNTFRDVATACYWPLVAACIVSNILCYFYLPFGRSMFAFTTALSIVNHLAFPPAILSPYLNFLAAIQITMSGVALALMYWSPLSDRFRDQSLA